MPLVRACEKQPRTDRKNTQAKLFLPRQNVISAVEILLLRFLALIFFLEKNHLLLQNTSSVMLF